MSSDPAVPAGTPGTRHPPIAWSWSNAVYGLALSVPAVVASLTDPAAGLPLAIGVIPAAAVGVRGPRRQRVVVVAVGAIAAVNIVIGSLVASVPIVAVATIFVLCVVAAVLVADPKRRLAPLILMFGMPLLGVGLSETPPTAVAAAGLIFVGSVYGWLVSLVWPARPAVARPPRTPAPRSVMVAYGIQIGIAGAAGAALGFALGVDHPGWACAAALLISRPDHDLLDSRSVGRVVSVLLGATAACAIAAADAPAGVIAVIVVAVIAGAAATAGSRRYVMPFFTTTIVLSMLIGDEVDSAPHWFVERVVLTLAGAAFALIAAWVVAAARRRP